MNGGPGDDTRDDENPAIHGSESTDAARTVPEVADQGKNVVDARGEDVGMVSDVEGNTLFVEPDPTLTERLMSILHWREGDRDELQVPAERIERIDDAVVLNVEPDGEEPS